MVILLIDLWKSAVNVGRRVDTVHDQAGGHRHIACDDVKALIPTRDAVKRVGAGLTRYVQAVARIL